HGLHVISSSCCLGSAFLIFAVRQDGRAGEVANAPSAEAEVLYPQGPAFAASSHGWWRLRESGARLVATTRVRGRARIGWVRVWVPITSSTSCDQVIFVDQATDVSVFSDAVLVEVDRFGQRLQRRGAVQGAVRPGLVVVA